MVCVSESQMMVNVSGLGVAVGAGDAGGNEGATEGAGVGVVIKTS